MFAQKNKIKINLLPQKGLAATVAGRILLWMLSTFRVIVIVTEIIVMIAFLSRFWLDAENTDLNEEIAQKQAVLAASLDFEEQFKETQTKLKIFSELTQNEILANSIQTTNSYLPNDVYLTSLSFSEKAINLKCISPNEKSIQQLIVNLNASGTFEKVSLTEVRTSEKDSSLFEFTINALLKKT